MSSQEQNKADKTGSTPDAMMTLFVCIRLKCCSKRWSLLFPRALWSHSHSYIDELHWSLLACYKDAEHKHSLMADYGSQNKLHASGKKACSHFLKISSRFCSTFSFDCAPRERCCLISAYSHVLYYSVLLVYLVRERKRLLRDWNVADCCSSAPRQKTWLKCSFEFWCIRNGTGMSRIWAVPTGTNSF